MLSPLRNRFGIPGVISVIALVFAMLGGAYAANNSSGGKATASAKGKPGPRGKTGKTGPVGPQGPAGPAGSAGSKGDKGDTGAKGDKGDPGNAGTPGTSGKNAEAIPFSGSKTISSVTCTEGGLEVKSASATTLVCNGVKGTDGTTGFTETLPPGKTETGAWASTVGAGGGTLVALSWSIPLPASVDAAHTIVVPAEGEGELGKCSDAAETTKGTSEEPLAAPGYFCIYERPGAGTIIVIREAGGPNEGASAVGAIMTVVGESGAIRNGAFAVTAPLP